jgi:REP element-mobilizing transposase RayT
MKCVLSRIENDAPVGADTIRPKIQLKPYGIIVDNAINQIEKHYECVFVDNYVIMPNHIHLLLRIDNYGRMVSAPTVSTVIGSLKRFVSQKAVPIWQKGFHDHVIRNEEDY